MAWLVRLASSRVFSLVLVVAIVTSDGLLHRQSLGFMARALLDEPCHFATALILLGTITRWRGGAPARPFTWALLISSVAIDIDHLPSELAARGLLYGGLPRPYTHALWLLVLLVAVAAVACRRSRLPGRPKAALTALIFAGAAWGIASHFLRDLATAPIALLWPFSGAWLQVPYAWYVAALIVMVILPLPLRRGALRPCGPPARLRGRTHCPSRPCPGRG